jgi:tetratricopeptide (TPR) repeat protein
MQRAVEKAKQAILESPRTAADYTFVAETLCNEGDLAGAIANADKAIELDPKHADAYVVRELCFCWQKQWERALAEWDQVIRLGQKLELANWKRGECLIELGRFAEAISALDEAAQVDPTNSDVYCSRGMAWAKIGNTEKAFADLEKAIVVDSGNARAFAARGWMYNNVHEFDLARADLNESLRREPSEHAHVGRAFALIELRRFDSAIADADQAIEIAPDLASAFAIRGWARLFLGQFRGAVSDFETAIQLYGEERATFAFYGYAWLLATCPDAEYRDGRRAFEYANRVRDHRRMQVWEANKLLAAALAEMGRFEEAIQLQRHAIQGSPDAQKEQLRDVLARYESHQAYVDVDVLDERRRLLPQFEAREPHGD